MVVRQGGRWFSFKGKWKANMCGPKTQTAVWDGWYPGRAQFGERDPVLCLIFGGFNTFASNKNKIANASQFPIKSFFIFPRRNIFKWSVICFLTPKNWPGPSRFLLASASSKYHLGLGEAIFDLPYYLRQKKPIRCLILTNRICSPITHIRNFKAIQSCNWESAGQHMVTW